ncbi:F-box protein At5g07610-like [Primulina tabacum]|uniref:F-box protein At5g07610-like n=1 Tax=Primulina tabacum TaxID=48773 RepID=UPI003F5A44BF
MEGGGGEYSGMEGCNNSPLAAESIFHNAHLLTEILRRLPSKSVIRFKSVCKSWRALIITEYFCLLWRQHQSPGILLSSGIDYRPHAYVPLSGPTAGVPQFELPHNVDDLILQSCNGFLLYMKLSGTPKYWVYNPATSEVVVLPQRLDTCKIHARRCNCVIVSPCLAFDSHSRGKVVALAEAAPRNMGGGYVYQVCVTENQGAWRRLGKPSRSRYSLSSWPVHWHNFIVWIGASVTYFYDVEAEVLRVGASPRCSTSYNSYHLGECGGHLHFIDILGSRLIIKEMKHDLSGWFVKHSIELSQMEASLFRSTGWDINTDAQFKINFLIEEKEDSKLVL